MPNLGKSLLALISGGTQGYTAAHERRLDRERQEGLDLQAAGRNDLLNQLTRLQIESGRKELDAPPVPRKPIPIGPYGAIGPDDKIIGGKGEGGGGLAGVSPQQNAQITARAKYLTDETSTPEAKALAAKQAAVEVLGFGGALQAGYVEDPRTPPADDPGDGNEWRYANEVYSWVAMPKPLVVAQPAPVERHEFTLGAAKPSVDEVVTSILAEGAAGRGGLVGAPKRVGKPFDLYGGR